MQGELKSSHAYEMGGEYKPKPVYKIGYLGADLILDEDKNLYKISHIVKGDIWDEKNKPPLLGPGVEVKEGDYLLSINGIEIKDKIPNEFLINHCGEDVEIVVSSSNNIEHKRKYVVKTLKNETPLRYREWVEQNKKYVHEKTDSRIGYIHIPDMGYTGYAEFHRNFLSEVRYDGLIIDVRVNSGGFVSSMILDKLNRKFIGYDLSPYREAEAYQYDSVRGPMVAITNEFAGSDGDIFSHSFKLMKLGKLIGKRTWGGVIGIWPRNPLVDQTITTQPEMAFWFKDVGWDVENYGTDPDIEIDITPKDYKEKKDPQLDMAIEIVLKQLKENPPIAPKDIKKP
jgi:tricorn protease